MACDLPSLRAGSLELYFFSVQDLLVVDSECKVMRLNRKTGAIVDECVSPFVLLFLDPDLHTSCPLSCIFS